jgi:hypothetical protein
MTTLNIGVFDINYAADFGHPSPGRGRRGPARRGYGTNSTTGDVAEMLVAFFCSAPGGAILPPRPAMMRPSRAVAVKDGPGLGPPAGLVLDGREHGGRLVCVGTCRMMALVLDRRKISER